MHFMKLLIAALSVKVGICVWVAPLVILVVKSVTFLVLYINKLRYCGICLKAYRFAAFQTLWQLFICFHIEMKALKKDLNAVTENVCT
jgi:hypothetical protein